MPCDHNPVTIFPNGFTYIAINGEQVMTLGAVSLVAHTSGVLPIDRGGTNATTPEQARINLGLGTAATQDSSAFATAAQGSLAETALQPGDDAAALGSDPVIPLGWALLTDGLGGADWGEVSGVGGGVPEAPLAGGPYGRKSAAWVAVLDEVRDDQAPQLGGNLTLAGNRVMITDALDAFHGALGYSPTVGAMFLSENVPGEYFEDKAGVSFQDGLLSLHGSRAQIKALVGAGNREVWVDPDGGLYPVAPAPPSWDVEDQSTAKVAVFGDADGVGVWTKIADLKAATEQAVAVGDAVGCTTRAYINNLSSAAGDLEFGWGIGTAEPAAGAGTAIVAVVPGQKGYVTANHFQAALAYVPAGTEIQAWVRALGPAAFGPWVDGLLSPHYLTIEAVGSATAGDVVITADTTIYVETTGNDVTGDGTTVGTAFATLSRAMFSLQGAIIVTPALVTIQFGAGDFPSAATVMINHPYGLSIRIRGQTAIGAVTGIVQADFTNPLVPVPGTRGANDLHNTAGMLATNATSGARTTARNADTVNNEALLRTIYPTRFVYSGSGPTLSVWTGLSDITDILFVSGGMFVGNGGIVQITTSLAGVATSMFLASRNASLFGNMLVLAGAAGNALIAQDAGQLPLSTLWVQGAAAAGLTLTNAGSASFNDTIVSGCGSLGLSINASVASVNPSAGVRKNVSITGNGSIGLQNVGGRFVWSVAGSSGNQLNVSGNNGAQALVNGTGFFVVTPTNVTTQLQASPTSAGISCSFNSQMSFNGPVTINSGLYGAYTADYGAIRFSDTLTLTNPITSVLRADLGGMISINGAVTAAAGLGTKGIFAQTGGKISDSGSTLSTLATASPTFFDPPFNKTLADGSAIIGGPVGAAGLLMGATAVTLGGSSLKADALAGTGSRTVMAAADGTLTATTLLAAMASIVSSGIPTSETSPGNVGEVHADADNIYLCTAPNFWRRVALRNW